jgi:hypothetical protein
MWQVSASTDHVLLPSTDARDSTRLGDADIAGLHPLRHHFLDAAEQRLVLELLVGEADDGLERGLVAERVLAADLEHLRGDEALDQAEQVRIGAALHLAQRAAL